MSKNVYDYIIVGAGSAGCVLANRLSANPDNRVLLLEAGGWDRDPWIHIPLGVGHIFQKRLHDWDYHTEPEEQVGGRRVECSRGRVIGGSSSINAMAYVRGHKSDYDRWADSGLPGWSYEEVLPYFRRQESWAGGSSRFRGAEGPLATRFSQYGDPLTDAILESGIRAGHPSTDDYNGAEQHGMALMQSTIKNGRRCSAAVGYLRPALSRTNLTVRTRALATRILFDGKAACGVEYLAGGKTCRAQADKEVVLSGGVFNSPQLLMLSGIGDATDLRGHGIKVHTHLPGVGRNLHDHVKVPLAYERAEPGPMHRNMRLDRITASLAQAYLLGTGFATDLPGPVCSFLKTSPDLPAPDIQILMNSGPMTAGPYFSPFVQPYQDGFSLLVVLLRPVSRGHVRLASADPSAKVLIKQNFLAESVDRQVLRNGVKMVRDIGRQRPMSAFVRSPLGPAGENGSDESIDAHIQMMSSSVHHPLGTCKMGLASDSMAVLDAGMQVYGVERLRVVDGAAMPDIVGGNINAPIIMMAERAADLIQGMKTAPEAVLEPA